MITYFLYYLIFILLFILTDFIRKLFFLHLNDIYCR
ncbi:unknown [Prevotella sp. CAG:1185]|nr:unknown [Prevotella sp. CAG:1185]